MTMIANNIVNRVDYNNESNVPYNNRSNQGKLNDEFVMMYIDVDNDKATYSSSSADLLLENQENKKIVYAGLYWSATYLYNSGKSPDVNKFKAIDPKRESFDHIKLKLPNQEYYNDITGELIFDGIKENNFKESAPYAMYANITDLVKENGNAFGTYTVANIKSTVGEISGGVSAGWTMFFVYEDKSMTGKFITSYDGFVGVTEKSTDVQFSGFQTLPEGNVNAKIACAGLEGDLNLKGDQFMLKADEDNEFTQLSNTLRDKSNIFNSSITNDNDFFSNRFPNSKNTLGYDSFIMTIDNINNTVIHNNTKDATLRFKTFGDRYFVFFNAFAVEVIKPKDVIEDKAPIATIQKVIPVQKIEPVVATKPIAPVVLNQPRVIIKPVVKAPVVTEVKKVETVKPVEVKKEPVVAEVKKVETVKPVEVKKEPVVAEVKKVEIVKPINLREQLAISEAKKATIVKPIEVKNEPVVEVKKPENKSSLVESPSVNIPTLSEGYYIVAGVFAVHGNAMRFMSKLKKKGLYVDYFVNPINNYRYIYLTKHKTFDEATLVYDSKMDGKYTSLIWIMTVNKSNNPGFVSYSKPNPNDYPVDKNYNKSSNASLVLDAKKRRKTI